MRLALLFAVALTLVAQPRFPMRRVLDLAPLQEKGGRVRPAGTGLTVEGSEGDESRIAISGIDAAGLPWRMESDFTGMIGLTTLWRGDLDANGRQDILLGSIENGNGRCVDGANVTIFLMGVDGRPMPWTFFTHYGYRNQNLSGVQPFLTDVDRNGHAELIAVSCEAGESMSEVRKITGIYEAHDGRMIGKPEFDSRLARRAASGAKLTPVPKWVDQHEGLDGDSTLHLTTLITGEVGCCSVCLEVVGNRVDRIMNDPCDDRRENRILFSDGTTRTGWPNLILDGPAGRRIILDGDGSQLRAALESDAEVRILGDPKSPDWLWVHLDPAKPATPLQQRLFIEPLGKEEPIADFAYMYAFGSGTSYVKSSVMIQLTPEPPSVRVLRSSDRGFLWERKFTRPEAGAKLTGVRQYHNGYLAQWANGTRHILTLHSDHGKQIGPPHPQAFPGELLWGDSHDELHFLIRKQGKPTSIVRMRSHVEWSR